jgi:hypothetical protein
MVKTVGLLQQHCGGGGCYMMAEQSSVTSGVTKPTHPLLRNPRRRARGRGLRAEPTVGGVLTDGLAAFASPPLNCATRHGHVWRDPAEPE